MTYCVDDDELEIQSHEEVQVNIPAQRSQTQEGDRDEEDTLAKN